MSIPYTKEELEQIREAVRKLPHYKNERVYSEDLPLTPEILRYERSPETIQSYQKYWNEQLGGSITIDEYIDYAAKLHETHLFFRKVIMEKDKNGDGQISEDEFKEILEFLRSHEPKMKDKTFAEFVQEADTDNDGVVDIDECVAWIQGYTK